MRGSLEPPCNAAGYIDRLILGEHHVYQRPVYRRTKVILVNVAACAAQALILLASLLISSTKWPTF